MEYNLSPPNTLQEIVLIAMAINLWTKSPVKDEVLELFKSRSRNICDDGWEEVEKILRKKIVLPNPLSLPGSLAEELSGISTQIVLEILAWAKYYSKYYCELDFFNNICWTPQGTVDAEKTARKLVSDQSVHIVNRYRVACINCFEDVIPDLWKQSSKTEKHLNGIKKFKIHDDLVILWSYHLYNRSSEITGRDPINEFGFKIAVDLGNSVAVRYFWPKLTPEERERNLEKCIKIAAKESFTGVIGNFKFPHSCYTNIVCFLLNQMSEKQQKNIFSDVGEYILCGLLNFPYQKLFIPISEEIWHYLQEKKEYDRLLYYITDKISNYPQLYTELLQYVWQKIPDKDKVINTWEAGIALSKLFRIEDHESIRFILSSVSVKAKEEFILDEGLDVCCSLVSEGKWNILKKFMKCCLQNKDVAFAFEAKAKKRISWYTASEKLQENAPQFYKLIDDHIASLTNQGEKRKIEDEDNDISAKKIRTDLEVKKMHPITTLGKVC